MSLSLALFPAIGVTFVLRREGPRLGRWTEEHLRDFDPVTAVRASQQSFCVFSVSLTTERKSRRRHAYQVRRGRGRLEACR